MNTKTTLLVATLAITAAASAPAQAGTTRIATTVSHRDLDLTTSEGVATLRHRIQIAIRHLCGTYERRDGLGDRPFSQCVRAANAEPALDAVLAAARKGEAPQTVTVAAR